MGRRPGFLGCGGLQCAHGAQRSRRSQPWRCARSHPGPRGAGGTGLGHPANFVRSLISRPYLSAWTRDAKPPGSLAVRQSGSPAVKIRDIRACRRSPVAVILKPETVGLKQVSPNLKVTTPPLRESQASAGYARMGIKESAIVGVALIRAVFDHTESSLRGATPGSKSPGGRRLYVLALRRRLALDARCEGCPDRPGGASRKEDEP